MTQAIELVQQTELGALVARREALNAAVADAKRGLKNYRNWHAPTPESIARANFYNQQELYRWTQKLEEATADLEGLQTLSGYANSESLKGLLSKLIKGLESDIQYAQQNVTNYASRISEASKVTDPRIEYSNALAAAEAELEAVRQQIKEARAK